MLKKIINNSLFDFSGKIFGRVIQFIADILIIRFFIDSTIHGTYVIVWSILRLVWIVLPLGLHNAIINFSSIFYNKDFNKFNSIINIIITLSLIFSIFIMLSFTFSINFISNSIYNDSNIKYPLLIIAFSFPLIILIRNLNALSTLRKTMFYKTLSEEIIWYLSFILSLIYIVSFKKDSVFIYYAILFSFFLSSISSIYFIHRSFDQLRFKPSINIERFRLLLSYSIPTMFAGIFNFTTLHINRLMVGSLLGLNFASFYHRAAILTLFFPLIIQSFVGILNPIIRENYNNKNFNRINDIYINVTKIIVLINIPISLALIFNGDFLLSLFFGEMYIENIFRCLIILCVNFLMISFCGPVVSIFIMCNMQSKWMIINFYSLLLGVTLSYFSIIYYGIEGAAVSTLISATFLYFYAVFIINKEMKMRPIQKHDILKLFIGIISLAFFYYFIPVNNILESILLIIINSLFFYYLMFKIGFRVKYIKMNHQ